MRETLTFRPSNDNLDLIDKLLELADKDNRDINNYIELLFLQHINSKKAVLKAPEPKGIDIVDKVLTEFLKAYYEVFTQTYFISNIGKERKSIGGLIKLYKKDNATDNTMCADFHKFFKSAMKLNDTWLHDNMSPSIIYSQFNKIVKLLRKDKKTDPAERPATTYDINIYFDSVPEFGFIGADVMIKTFHKINTAFPSLPLNWYDVLYHKIMEAGYTNEMLITAVDHVIQTHTYPRPQIALFFNKVKTLKYYTYDEVVKKADPSQLGNKVWSLFSISNEPGKEKMWVNIAEAKAMNLGHILKNPL